MKHIFTLALIAAVSFGLWAAEPAAKAPAKTPVKAPAKLKVVIPTEKPLSPSYAPGFQGKFYINTHNALKFDGDVRNAPAGKKGSQILLTNQAGIAMDSWVFKGGRVYVLRGDFKADKDTKVLLAIQLLGGNNKQVRKVTREIVLKAGQWTKGELEISTSNCSFVHSFLNVGGMDKQVPIRIGALSVEEK